MNEALIDPATFIISRVMRPGQEAAHDAWVNRVIATALASIGISSTTRLDQAGGVHHLLLHFHDTASLTRWKVGQYPALAEQARQFSFGLDQQAQGVASAFTLPSEAAAKKWKTALVTRLGVVPTLLVFSSLIGWAAPSLPRVVQQIISSVLLTVTLTWIILPRVRSWSRFWMLQDSKGKLRRSAD